MLGGVAVVAVGAGVIGAAVVFDVPGSVFEHAPMSRTNANTIEREIMA